MSERKERYDLDPLVYLTDEELQAFIERVGLPLQDRHTGVPQEQPDPRPAGPTFLLISLPRDWSPGGVVQSASLIIVRDQVPDQGIAVDVLPVNLDVKSGSLARIKEWLECL